MSFLPVVAFALAVAWFPIIGRFVRSWLRRRNPVSMAIAANALLGVYVSVQPILDPAPRIGWLALAANGATCLVFHLSIRWADRRFPESRGR